ncbi:MAG: DNA translocase FtsK, partial [Sphaerochaetaceae bacterium]|nr:DNA translocase FtsK [Sphaerochaetaceae bacterium]
LELYKKNLNYRFPPESLLKHYPLKNHFSDDFENDPVGLIIVETLKEFKIETKVVGVQHGAAFSLYKLDLQRGVKVTSLPSYADTIAMRLSVNSVRVLAPIPGMPFVGIEVPNKNRDVIGFDVLMPNLKNCNYAIPMVLGQKITGENVVVDVAKAPHMLVAGTTGSGKSVCINGLICSVLMTKSPKDVRMILVDPKRVELSGYNEIPHLLTPVITEPKKALKAMNFICDEMERRMEIFRGIGAKNIVDYNKKIESMNILRVKLPYILIIIDEFADLVMAVGKELENTISRITAVARFAGIVLVLATQRPSADVITGIIKSNIPVQIAFTVSNAMNSRIIIDDVGAEKLLGMGDMLYNNPKEGKPQRIQGALIDSEIEDIVAFVKTQGEPDYIDEAYLEEDEDDDDVDDDADDGKEDDFSRAWKLVSEKGEASASYIQRRLSVGYNKAANLIEMLEDAGYIGPARGSKPREVLRYYGSD